MARQQFSDGEWRHKTLGFVRRCEGVQGKVRVFHLPETGFPEFSEWPSDVFLRQWERAV